MAPPQYNKLGKKVKDLFKKEYDFGYRVKTTNKASAGVKFETSAKESSNGIAGTTKVNYSADFGKLELQLANAGSDKDTNGKATFTQLVDGLELSVGVNASPEVNTEFVYAIDSFAATLKTSTNIDSLKHKVGLEASVGLGDITVGGAVGLNSSFAIDSYDAGVEYTNSSFVAAVKSGKQFQNFDVSYFHKYSKDTVFGANVGLSLKGDVLRGVQFGADHKISSDVSLKGKIDNNANTAVVLSQKLASPQMKFTVAHSFNALDNKKAKKFGVGLSFGDY
jgi:hypothetical protein